MPNRRSAMIKAKFGDSVAAARHCDEDEALCKILCHNICCLISAFYELKIEANFGMAAVA